MNTRKPPALLAALWRHTSAAVALALILAALIVGYRIGKPDAKPRGDTTTVSDHDHADETQYYTCSMHPSVRLTDPNAKCPICFMDLIPVPSGAHADTDTNAIALSDAAASAARVETTKVARLFPTATVRLFGKVTYDETSLARLTAYFPARIDRLFVNYVGVPVAKGDHLAEVYSPELLAAFEELRQVSASAKGSGSGSDIVRQATRDTLVAAREKLRLFGLTEDQIRGVESGDVKDDRLTVYAPIGGVVTHLAVREGDYVQTGAPIATVADLSRLWLDLEAYESQLPLLRWGQRVTFTVEAHPGETFEGRISFIEPLVDERTRTAAVRVAVDNTDLHLKPGMFATAIVRPQVAADGAVLGNDLAGRWVGPMHPTVVKDGPGTCDICGMDLVPAESLGVVGDPATAVKPLVVPRSAVLFTGTRSVVYVRSVADDRTTYEGREVVLGPRAGDYYIVRSGLAEGDEVVTNGAFRVDSATQIAAKPSMMSDRTLQESAASEPASDFVMSLVPVYAAYLKAQEALAADNLDAYVGASAELRAAATAVSVNAITGADLHAWHAAAGVLGTPDIPGDLDAARTRFNSVSQAVIDLQRRFGHTGDETWSLVHCPMAFDSAGADWVQRGTQVSNPYYGSRMLRCGTVREELAPVATEAHP